MSVVNRIESSSENSSCSGREQLDQSRHSQYHLTATCEFDLDQGAARVLVAELFVMTGCIHYGLHVLSHLIATVEIH